MILNLKSQGYQSVLLVAVSFWLWAVAGVHATAMASDADTAETSMPSMHAPGHKASTDSADMETPSPGHMGHGVSAGTDGHGGAPVHVHAATDETALFNSVGMDEKLGRKIPSDIVFRDSGGRSVRLGDLLGVPVILQLVFYSCPQSCNLMMAGLATILGDVTATPGKDYRIVTISFDTDDTPDIAADTKFNYMKLLPPGFPEDQWHYLTGDVNAVRDITRAVGFRFKKTGVNNFIHPNVMTVLGPDGTIIRYLYGLDYLPFDVSMALTEASRGTPAISIKKLLTYCFDYDPKGKKYVFKSFQAAAVAVLLVLGGFFYFLLRKGNR